MSALTGQIGENLAWYTGTLGLRLVKKTVNQDDPRMYHLFYADHAGTPGTEMTFFDFPMVARQRKGNDSITRTTFRITGEEAVSFWSDRLGVAPVSRDGRTHLDIEDGEGTSLSLIEDGGLGPRGVPRHDTDVPPALQVQGLGYSGITVRDPAKTARFLEQGLLMEKVREYALPSSPRFLTHVYSMGDFGPQMELHVTGRDDLPRASAGAGSVHHVALRMPDMAAAQWWLMHLLEQGYSNSGLVDRFWFRSIYITDPNGIVIELATDTPGFTVDEPLESLGSRLVLPPFLEPRRAEVEARLPPLPSPS